MFQQTFKNLDDVMFQEPGCNTELDYVEQSSWMLFLKYLDGLRVPETPVFAGLTCHWGYYWGYFKKLH